MLPQEVEEEKWKYLYAIAFQYIQKTQKRRVALWLRAIRTATTTGVGTEPPAAAPGQSHGNCEGVSTFWLQFDPEVEQV